MQPRVMIVDDDEDIRNMLAVYLRNEGYLFDKCASAEEMFEAISRHPVDLILLDIMMPGMDGFSACARLREISSAPILFMSAKSGEMDKINGLSLGADDYITKPFHPLELMARIKSNIRRYRQYDNAAPETLDYKSLSLNLQTHQVWADGEPLRLTPKEYGILEYLIRNRGIVLTVRQIYETVWQEEYIENDNVVLMHISNLRGKLQKLTGDGYIKTVWGVGYQI